MGALVGGRHQIYIFERASGRIVQRSTACRTGSSTWRSRRTAASGGLPGWVKGIRVYETTDFGEVAADRDYSGDSYWAAFDREGRLVTSSVDGQIRLYCSDFRLIELKKVPGGSPFGVAFSPDGAQLAVGYFESTRVDVLDGSALAPLFQADTTGVNWDLSIVGWSGEGAIPLCRRSPSAPAGRVCPPVGGGRPGRVRGHRAQPEHIMDLRPLADATRLWRRDPSLGISARTARSFGTRTPPRRIVGISGASSPLRAMAHASPSVSS